MSLGAKIKYGTGMATCILCGQFIKKGQPSIHITGWHTEGQCHSLSKHCNCNRIDPIKFKEEEQDKYYNHNRRN